MKVSEKYANQEFGGMRTMTVTLSEKCKHLNGWYVTVPFWVFKKRIFVCSNCGHQEPK